MKIIYMMKDFTTSLEWAASLHAILIMISVYTFHIKSQRLEEKIETTQISMIANRDGPGGQCQENPQRLTVIRTHTKVVTMVYRDINLHGCVVSLCHY